MMKKVSSIILSLIFVVFIFTFLPISRDMGSHTQTRSFYFYPKQILPSPRTPANSGLQVNYSTDLAIDDYNNADADTDNLDSNSANTQLCDNSDYNKTTQYLAPILAQPKNACANCYLYKDIMNVVIKSKNNGRHPSESCRAALESYYCKNSYWRDLTVKERFNRVLQMAQTHLAKTNINYPAKFRINPAVIPCIAAKETTSLEPLTISQNYCSNDPDILKKTSDRGLGQVVRATFYDLLGYNTQQYPKLIKRLDAGSALSKDEQQNLKFISDTFPYNTAEYVANPRKLENAILDSAELQVELMTEVLRKKLQYADAKGDLYRAIMLYNAGIKQLPYTNAVYSCYQCLRNDATNPLACLKRANPSVPTGKVCK